MSTSTPAAAPAAAGIADTLRPYLAEAHAELLRVWRTPGFVLPCLLFPVAFYLLFGILLGGRGAASYLLATYCVFGAMGPALFGFGVQLAQDRGSGLFALKRALPVPALAPLLARLVMAVVFAIIVAVLLLLTARFAGGVVVPPMQMLGLLGVAAFVALPLGGIGLLIGAHASAGASVAIVNMVYLPLALLSGLWLPLSQLPDVLQRLAPLWPSWHAAQLALPIVGHAASGTPLRHVAVMLGVTVLFTALAAGRLRKVG